METVYEVTILACEYISITKGAEPEKDSLKGFKSQKFRLTASAGNQSIELITPKDLAEAVFGDDAKNGTDDEKLFFSDMANTILRVHLIDAFVPLPGKPVAVGDKWRNKAEITIQSLAQAVYNREYVLVGRQIHEGKPVEAVTWTSPLELKALRDDKGLLPFKITEMKSVGKPQNEGTVLWDRAAKRPIRIDCIQTYEIDMMMEIKDKAVKAKGKGSDAFVIRFYAKNPDVRADSPEMEEPKLLYTQTLKDYGAEWLGFSKDGTKLFILANELTEEGKARRLVMILDAISGKPIRSLGIEGAGRFGAVSLDGARVVLDEFRKDPTVRDMKDGAVVATLKGHKGRVLSAGFSPDGSKVVTASDDKTAKVWDAATGECLATLTGHALTVASAEFSPDGKRVATGSFGSEIKIWNVANGECLTSLPGMSTASNPTMFSADGKRVVCPLHETPAVSTVADGKLIQEFKGHKSWVRSARFDPTGKRIVTAGLDTTVRVWDAATGKELFQLPGHNKEALFADFSPDGKHVVTTGADRNVNVWQVPLPK